MRYSKLAKEKKNSYGTDINDLSFRKILVPITADNPVISKKLTNYAISLSMLGEKPVLENERPLVVLICVIEDLKQGGAIGLQAKYGNVRLAEGFENVKTKAARQLIGELKVSAEEKGLRVKSEIVLTLGKSVAMVLTEFIQQHNIELVIIGAGDLFKLKYLLVGGSVTGYVIKNSNCPILLVR
jgi:nucleotide-binding universal stress UspA family protein